MPYHSIDEILRRCRDRACPFWQVVLTTQAKETQVPESAVLDQMTKWQRPWRTPSPSTTRQR